MTNCMTSSTLTDAVVVDVVVVLRRVSNVACRLASEGVVEVGIDVDVDADDDGVDSLMMRWRDQ